MYIANTKRRLRALLSRDTTGGFLVLAAAIAALVVANSGAAGWYANLSSAVIGPYSLHLDLTVAEWAADGLLAVFFLVVGLELKHELVAGSLRNPRHAGVPMLAAVGGMVIPAIVFTVVLTAAHAESALHGWAIPTATDIAFALAVLAVFGRGLPVAARTFLLTLAVVDDLLAIIVIAVFYSHGFHWWALVASLALIGVIAWVVRWERQRWWVLAPLAVGAWAFMHASGVHATVAGVLIGLTVPAVTRQGERAPRALRWGHAVSPWSQCLVLPVFAFFAAGVTVDDDRGLGSVFAQPVVIAIGVALVLGKLLGVLGTTALVTRITPLRLPDGLNVRDLLPIGFLAGIGFTVALLVADLSFGRAAATGESARLAVLVASALAAIFGALSLRWDVTRRHARVEAVAKVEA